MPTIQHDIKHGIADRVNEDPELEPEEKELLIRVAKSDDIGHVTTDVASLARRLLHLDAFDLDAVRTDSEPVVWSDPDSIDTGDSVYAVQGTVPIGALTIGESRDSDQPYRIVDHHSKRR